MVYWGGGGEILLYSDMLLFIYISSIILQRISCSPDALPVLSVCLFFLYSLLAGHRTDFALNYTCEIPF